MTTEETRAFIKENGVADTLVVIFQKIKEFSEKGERYLDVAMPDTNIASKFNQVLNMAGYTSTVITRNDMVLILIYI